jgi:cell division protein ZapA
LIGLAMNDPKSGVLQVKIYDREYVLRTSGDPDRLQKLCSELDKRMREACRTSGAADTLKAAMLAALSLADDLDRVQAQLKKMDESVGQRSKECVTVLDRFLY